MLAEKEIKNALDPVQCQISQIDMMGSIHITVVVEPHRTRVVQKENLKSYTRDRRAYEYWSDGNIHAANQFMGSSFFDGTSADHIGPISLGFVHDPRYLQPMPGGDNSSKRDRLQIVDIESIIETEKRTGVYPMSWYSKLIWEYIKTNYSSNPDKVPTV